MLFLFFIFRSQVALARTYMFPTKIKLTESQNNMQPDAVCSFLYFGERVEFWGFFADAAGVSGDHFEILE